MTDYTKVFIYKIQHKNLEVKDFYVGQTTNLKSRRNSHKKDCCNVNSKSYNASKYTFIRNNGGWSNWEMVVIEEYKEGSTKQEALQREQYWINELKPTLNELVAFMTDYERKAKDKLRCKTYSREIYNHTEKRIDIRKNTTKNINNITPNI